MENVRGVGGITPPHSPEPEKEKKTSSPQPSSEQHHNALYDKIMEAMGPQLGRIFWNMFINSQISLAQKASKRATAAMKHMGESG